MTPKANKRQPKKKPLKKKAQIQKPKAGKKLKSNEGRNKSLYVSEEIIFDILKWLPSISLLRFKSKQSPFLPIITSKPFLDSHFAASSSRPDILISCYRWTNLHRHPWTYSQQPHCDLYSVDLEQLRAVPFTFFNLKSLKDIRFSANEVSNCVNGVVLVKRNGKLRACNLSTREFIDVPLPSPQCDSCSYLLGFDQRSKSFKVLAYCDCSPTWKAHFFILTLGTNVWRKMERKSPCSYMHEIVCINGTIYIGGDGKKEVYAFDLATEKIRPIQLPVPPSFGKRSAPKSSCSMLFQFNESLGFADFQLENEKTTNIRVWKLTENFLWVEKTNNSFSLSFPFRLKVTDIPCSIGGLWVSPENNDELLLFVRFTTQYMIRWNLNNNTTQYVKISGLPRSHFYHYYRVDPYVQNLVSLKDL